MSWLAKSLANSLRLDDDNNYSDEKEIYIEGADPEPTTEKQQHADPASSSQSEIRSPRGVKEDLSEFTRTLTRQFWGVASFLAPPPQASNNTLDAASSESFDTESDGISGIRNDFAEIGGKLRTGISKLSSNKTVSEITKMASDFLQLGAQDQDFPEGKSTYGAIGVTDEVISFARDISMHPETWLDFPLTNSDGLDDFDMSEVQYDHALAIERHAPGLASVRIELCPRYLSESCFWKIYFVLLHPRLNQNDVQLLSTPEIEDARRMLLQKPPEKDMPMPNPEPVDSQLTETNPGNNEHLTFTPSPPQQDDSQQSTITSTEVASVHPERPEQSALDPKPSGEKYEDDTDDWLKDENVETSGAVPLGNDEDVSVSDLEDNDDPVAEKKTSFGSDPKDPKDWVDIEEMDMA